jgi:tryptophanase
MRGPNNKVMTDFAAIRLQEALTVGASPQNVETDPYLAAQAQQLLGAGSGAYGPSHGYDDTFQQTGLLTMEDQQFLNDRVPRLMALARTTLTRNAQLSPGHKSYVAAQAAIALLGSQYDANRFAAAKQYAMDLMG